MEVRFAPPSTRSRAASRGQPGGISIQISDEETGEVVFARNPDAPATIASVTKLISTATALHYLGPEYRFRTSFWRRGEVREGSLMGSLLVVGGGDPNISGRFYDDDINAVFDKWAEGLRQAGITRVVGEIVMNAAFFDSVGRHPDWPAGQESRWYQAPISALSYNDNVVLVSIRPGGRPGRPVGVSIEPPVDILRPVAAGANRRPAGPGPRRRVAIGRVERRHRVRNRSPPAGVVVDSDHHRRPADLFRNGAEEAPPERAGSPSAGRSW